MNLRLLLLALAAPLVVASNACAQDKADIHAGRQLAKAYCSQCHAIGRWDRSKHAAAPPLRDLSARYPIADLGPRFASGFSAAHPDMPHWTMDPPEVRQMLAYIESIQPKRRQPAP